MFSVSLSILYIYIYFSWIYIYPTSIGFQTVYETHLPSISISICVLNPGISEISLRLVSSSLQKRTRQERKSCDFFASMADLLSKSNLVSPCPHLCLSVSPKKCSPTVGFPPLQFQSLKSSTNRDFLGRNMVLPEGQMQFKRGSLLHAQVCLFSSFNFLLLWEGRWFCWGFLCCAFYEFFLGIFMKFEAAQRRFLWVLFFSFLFFSLSLSGCL